MKIQIGDRKLWITWRHINPKFGKKNKVDVVAPPVLMFSENGMVSRKMNDNAFGTQCSIYDDTPRTDRPPILYAGETQEVPDETESDALIRSRKSGPIAKGRSILHSDDLKRYSKEIGRQESLKKAMKAAGFTKNERMEIWQQYHNRPRFNQPKSAIKQPLIDKIYTMEERLDKALKANGSVVKVGPSGSLIATQRDFKSPDVEEAEVSLKGKPKPATIWDSLFSIFK